MENADGRPVDQHAAHERFFEELRRRMEEAGSPTQNCFIQTIDVPPRDADDRNATCRSCKRWNRMKLRPGTFKM